MPIPTGRAKIPKMLSYSLAEKLGHTFELGPIRPPSEAYSLLIRATRNCPWNRCQFCPVYKGSKFELRSVAQILRDIEAAKAISEGIKEMAWKMGYGDRVREVAATLCNQPQYGQCVCHVALWLGMGGKTAFLQDSNTLIMRTPELIQVITFLRKTFPSLNRVTTYGRSHTAARKSLAELVELKDAGLDRIHIGLETGYDPLLVYMEKGCTGQNHIEGGRRVKEAGISLCEYVMPGLGGRKMFLEHARETARVLNEIDPDYIRLRSLHVSAAMPLWTRLQSGDFELQTEDEVVEEIRIFLENLHVTSYLKSDHILNLLMEIEGKMPEDKEKCLNIIDKYLSLPEEERLNFKVGRRAGLYNRLAELSDSSKHDKIEQGLKLLTAEGSDVEAAILKLKNSFI
ncbi:MAG TPA: radical SAM protein [Dehalococcoidia bacterium]|nr:radical SAM protein [Dehalococcoidia bacterium]